MVNNSFSPFGERPHCKRAAPPASDFAARESERHGKKYAQGVLELPPKADKIIAPFRDAELSITGRSRTT